MPNSVNVGKKQERAIVKHAVRAKPKAADITWAKDHAGVFRAVEVIDPEPDGPRQFHTDAGVVC